MEKVIEVSILMRMGEVKNEHGFEVREVFYKSMKTIAEKYGIPLKINFSEFTHMSEQQFEKDAIEKGRDSINEIDFSLLYKATMKVYMDLIRKITNNVVTADEILETLSS